MSTGGLTFGTQKATLALACDNGVKEDDPRVMRRTNEAIQELLLSVDPRTDGALIPVGTMATYYVPIIFGYLPDAPHVGQTSPLLYLPPELENAIEWHILPPGTANLNTDVSQGSVARLVNPSTYVDPESVQDDPLDDKGLVPSIGDPTILQRLYVYPGASTSATVSVTGKKRFIPITSDDDYLIIQHVPAVKRMIQGIERMEARNGLKDGLDYKAEAIKMLSDEIKNHLSDPMGVMRNVSDFRNDLINFATDTFGHLRARIALEVPGMKGMGRSELGYMLDQSEREAVDHHNFLGRTERYSLEDGPNQLEYATTNDPATVLPVPDFEVLRLLVIAQHTPPAGVQPPADATPARQQAFALIERNLAASVESLRTAAHLTALGQYPAGSKGWTVARIGLELPKALEYTVNRLAGALERAELRLMEDGTWKGCIEEFNATVTNGHIYWPARVEAVLSIIINGHHASIRSIFYKYVKDGPGQACCTCNGRFEDEGEKYFPSSGDRRRVYRAFLNDGTPITAVCKLRWLKKELTDQMTIQNLNALRIMTDGILTQQDDAAAASAEMILNKELREYLRGIELTFPNLSYAGVGDLGRVL